MSESRIRICRVHNSVMNADRPAWGGCHYALWAFASGRQAVGSDIPTNAERVERCDDIVEMVWSSDRSALLVVDECDCEPGDEAIAADIGQGGPCGGCDGRGYTYRARVRSGKPQFAIAADSYNEGWSDALDARDTDRVAVVPL